MKILVYGSLNLDFVYRVDAMVRPGETISSAGMETFPGGKGLNQAIALGRAGAAVYLAGAVGEDGGELVSLCEESGVDCRHVRVLPGRSGHAIIQVDRTGQNCILLYAGANRQNTEERIARVLAGFEAGDMLLLQNEINLVPSLIDAAWEKGMTVALNPSPFDGDILACDLSKVGLLLLNELEGAGIAGQGEPEQIAASLRARYPKAEIVLTLGGAGALCATRDGIFREGVRAVPVVDTTAAGDTFTGYYLAGRMEGRTVAESLGLASTAAGLAVSRRGAAVSIPYRGEVEEALQAP